MSAFWPTSSSEHASKPALAAVLFQLTLSPQPPGSVPDSALRDSMKKLVVRSSRSCTGTVPLRPSPLSSSALTPPTSAPLGDRRLVGAVALNVGLPSAVYVAAAVSVKGMAATAAVTPAL